jgi:membrane-associated protease RseP (regulator of RpoE activity)
MLVESARSEAQAEILTDDDRRRAFYNLPPGKKIVVMAGGPLVNLALAVLLFTLMFVGFGTPGPTLRVSTVSECLPSSATDTGECPAGAVPSAAAAAGVQPGDELVALGGTPVASWSDFTAALVATGPGATTVTVVRDGSEQTLPVTLPMVERPVVVDGRDTGRTELRPFLGVGPRFDLQPQPVTAVPALVWDMTVRSAQALVTFPAKLVGVGEAAFGNAERDPEGPIGMVGASRISGEVAGGDMPGTWKIAQLIGIIASVNLFLFLFNMIPLLPLDGGHIAGAMYEGARRKVASWRGQPDPGPADVAKLLPIAYGVAMVLVVVSVLLIYADIVAPVKLG